jgi:phosphoribosylaminoimidazolecarboxamide formyltransferase/IMP cyclohydrolase
LAEALSELFVECLVAPAYAGDALRLLQRKKNIRILEPGPDDRFGAWAGHLDPGLDVRGVVGGLLVQSSPAPARPQDLRPATTTCVVTRREPTTEEWDEISFAWAVTQSVKSNAIVLTRDGGTIGIGAGQMSRVDAVKLATRKAGDAGLALAGATLASDAFFPFRDGVDAAADAGVRVIVQPGGSKRDDEAVQAADQHDMAMVFTGRRLFRH